VIRRLCICLVLGIAGAAIVSGCGAGGSSTSTITVAATGPAGAAPAASQAATATGAVSAPAAATPAATTGTVSAGAVWNGALCNARLIAWQHSHPSSSAQDAHVYKQSLRRRHGCFEASSLEPVAASKGAWNSAQCNSALIAWERSHLNSGTKALQATKQTLRVLHGCFTASSLTVVPAAKKSTWSSVQCNATLVAWYKSHTGTSAQAAQTYKHSLRVAHGCFTASSSTPP